MLSVEDSDQDLERDVKESGDRAATATGRGAALEGEGEDVKSTEPEPEEEPLNSHDDLGDATKNVDRTTRMSIT